MENILGVPSLSWVTNTIFTVKFELNNGKYAKHIGDSNLNVNAP